MQLQKVSRLPSAESLIAGKKKPLPVPKFSDFTLAHREDWAEVIAIDCETTGAELRHQDECFMVTMVFRSNGRTLRFVWDVDPTTRTVLYEEEDIEQIRRILNNPDNFFIFHNAKFDVLALCTIRGLNPNPFSLLKRCRDTVIESHIISSSQSHALKDVSLKFSKGEIGLDDQDRLRAIVNKARDEGQRINAYFEKIGKSPPIMLANEACFSYTKRAPTEGWWVVDMWLPAALEKWKTKYWIKNQDQFKRMGITLGTLSSGASIVLEYCERDSIRTLFLDSLFWPEIQQNEGWLFHHQNQTRLLEVVYRMEMTGVSIHRERIKDISQKFKKDAESKFARCKQISGNPDFNPASAGQLRKLLYVDWYMPIRKRTDPSKNFPEGQASTDIDALQQMIDDLPEGSNKVEFLKCLIIGKKLFKNVEYLTSYDNCSLKYHLGANDKFNVRWRIHPSYNITGTDTTRFSSKNPNAQNIGKGKLGFEKLKELFAETNLSLRRVFGPSIGREWWTVDYKQLQLAIFAYVSGDREMIKEVEAGRDFHDFMTRKIFNLLANATPDEGQRRIGKDVDFGYIFGAGAAKIDAKSKMKGLSNVLREMFPAVTTTTGDLSQFARRHGYVDVAGYRLDVDPDRLYSALNYVVQGYEGLIVKLAMILCHDYLMEMTGGQAFITLNVHDELVFDFPQGEGEQHMKNITDLMCEAGSFYNMRLNVDVRYVSDNWSEGETVEFVGELVA